MRDATEQEIQKTILDYLKLKGFIIFKHRNVGIYKQDTGKYIPLAFGEKGIPDLIACAPGGSFWGIEVKRRGGKVSPDQTDFIERVRAKGGHAFVAYSLDDVIREVDAARKGMANVSPLQTLDNAALKNTPSKAKDSRLS